MLRRSVCIPSLRPAQELFRALEKWVYICPCLHNNDRFVPVESLDQSAMETGRHSKKRQQQSGRAVLVTFYVARPRRKDGGGTSAGSSSRQVHHHHHHHDVHHHHHHHLHHRLRGGSDEARRRGQEKARSYDRRAELLEYSRQMRAMAAAATTRPVHPEPRRDVEAAGAGRYPVHPPPASDPRLVYLAGLIESLSGGAVRLAGHPPAAGDDRRLVEVERRRLERAESQQQVRQRCLGLGGDWSWKRVLKLVLPCQSSTARASTRSRTGGRDDNDGKEGGKAARAWPAAVQLVSKLKVNRTSRRAGNGGDEGLLKKLFSTFQRQRSRPDR